MDDQTTRRLLLQQLESLARSGVEQLPVGRALAAEVLAPMRATETSRAATATPAAVAPSAAMGAPTVAPRAMVQAPAPTKNDVATGGTSADLKVDMPRKASSKSTAAIAELELLKTEVASCTLCKDLARTRKQTVFGVGNTKPKIVIFGEAPGADEDRTGEPFVGRAGQLLTKIIEACGWKREEVYIMNVLKCRPPDNRTPVETEIEHCRPFFEKQIELLDPKYIICVGTVPAQSLLRSKEPVGRMRGRFHEYDGRRVLVTYHPSYLLRNPSAKKFVWDDMQMLLKDMGLPIPQKPSS